MALNIAVILPERYRGGTLRGALNITRMLALGAAAAQDKIILSFGHVNDPQIYSDNDFDDIKKLGVRVRPFDLVRLPGSSFDPLYDSLISIQKSDRSPEYIIFNDGMSNFEDADFWLIVSDRLQACIPPHRRYCVVVYDYIQRYVPEIFGTTSISDGNWLLFEKYAEIARKADFVICTTQQTRSDCINYVGVSKNKAIKFPQEFDPVSDGSSYINVNSYISEDVPYIIWTTNSTQHKNHLNIINGLEQYFSKFPDSNLEIRMTGVYTHLFDLKGESDLHYNDPYAVQVRGAIAKSNNLRKRLKILGNLADRDYLYQLANATWLLHGALYDNGTFSIIEAAWFGVPSISSNYPAIIECCHNFGIEAALFDPYSPESLYEKLCEVFPLRNIWSSRLPDREYLSLRHFSSIAPEYWAIFKAAVEVSINP